jgi:uncharacterized protein YhjY with autotransporter beta-barrel domain
VTRFIGTPLRGIEFSSVSDEAISARINGDGNPRIRIDAGGRITWSSGSATGDTKLYRSDIGTLFTDGILSASGGLVTLTTSGSPTVSMPNGALAVDITNSILYFRANDVWNVVTAGAGGATDLDGLTDVIITAPEEFQGLSYDGTNWVNSHIPLVSYVRNAEATTITTGTCVYLFGATGDHATIKRADNSSDTTSSKTIGVAGANITASNNGPIVTRGYVDGINLSTGYSPGDILWLGKNGAFTKTKPSAPDHLVFIGVVVRATNNGIIYVATQNGYELDELHDVSISTKTDKDVLMWNASSSVWVNEQINLGTDTVGNYMSGVVAGTGLTVSHTPGEGSTASIGLNASLNDLSDVVTSSVSVNQVLKWDGSNWVNGTVSAGQAAIQISDTAPADPSPGDLWFDSINTITFIYYDNAWLDINATLADQPKVEDLADVGFLSAPADKEVLVFDGTGDQWIKRLLELSELSDVSISSPTNGDFLRWNGTSWINDAVNLSTDTVGNYVQSLVAGTGITITNNSGEGTTPTVAIGQDVTTTSSVTFAKINVNGNASVSGDIYGRARDTEIRFLMEVS